MVDSLYMYITNFNVSMSMLTLCITDGNIYIYTTEEMTTFTNEFCNLLNELKRMKHDIYTCGDYNINLLNINSNIHCINFF